MHDPESESQMRLEQIYTNRLKLVDDESDLGLPLSTLIQGCTVILLVFLGSRSNRAPFLSCPVHCSLIDAPSRPHYAGTRLFEW
jgi:hypothetical protein